MLNNKIWLNLYIIVAIYSISMFLLILFGFALFRPIEPGHSFRTVSLLVCSNFFNQIPINNSFIVFGSQRKKGWLFECMKRPLKCIKFYCGMNDRWINKYLFAGSPSPPFSHLNGLNDALVWVRTRTRAWASAQPQTRPMHSDNDDDDDTTTKRQHQQQHQQQQQKNEFERKTNTQ